MSISMFQMLTGGNDNMFHIFQEFMNRLDDNITDPTQIRILWNDQVLGMNAPWSSTFDLEETQPEVIDLSGLDSEDDELEEGEIPPPHRTMNVFRRIDF